jgi:hypothetical protein
MMVYISGPMTGIEGFNFPEFYKAERLLRSRGVKVFNPAQNSLECGFDYADYLRFDIQAILFCDKMYMLKGWESSKGASLEKSIAEALGYEVEYQI